MRYGATADEDAELTDYARSAFEVSAFDRPIDAPLPDEPFVAAWERYVVDAARIGVDASLRARLVQLRFPIEAGMSKRESYLAATRRGAGLDAVTEPGVRFVDPEHLRLFIHPTVAGRVPIIVASAREDFVALVQALTCRNEPKPIPASMGACIVSGYNNWDRVFALRPRLELSDIASRKELYQDRFIILSSGPYSGVDAGEMGLTDAEWRRLSLTIRLEHECAHYVTRQILGSMRNSLLDELIADFAGIVAAIGRYRADWFLRFLGLESASGCRPGGRMHNYRGAPALSDGAFTVLQRVVRRAAARVEEMCAPRGPESSTPLARTRTIVALAQVGLEGLA
jgi:uncharacterized protein DUF7005